MILKKYILIILFVFAGVGQISATLPKDSLITFQDDPIASMLDSLANLKYFEKGHTKPAFPKSNKYHFSPDSIPKYDDLVYESRLAKLDAQSPFDLQYNDVVKAYIDLYTIRKRELVSRLMGLSQFYFPLFEETLDKFNIPLELKYLAIVESALNPSAKSRSGAMGLWQFMYGTGKMYNLNVTSYVDERCDPYLATVAACEYFQFLYGMFGDWQMVLAAYNGGPGTVNKAIRRSGGKKTYWEIRPFLPKETQGYVPAFIAVNYVMNYTTEHNIYSSIPKRIFSQVDTIHIKQQISFNQIATVLNIPLEDIEFLNPAYKKGVIPFSSSQPYYLCLPSSKIGSFITNETAIYNYLRKDPISSQTLVVMQEVVKTHTVKKGEHLNLIARRYKCTVSDLKTWNNLKSTYVNPGKKLIVYVKNTNPATSSIAEKNQKKSVPVIINDKYYIIQRGDTLWDIAKNNGVTVEELKKWNKLDNSYVFITWKKDQS